MWCCQIAPCRDALTKQMPRELHGPTVPSAGTPHVVLSNSTMPRRFNEENAQGTAWFCIT
jgi:hypothetical protein